MQPAQPDRLPPRHRALVVQLLLLPLCLCWLCYESSVCAASTVSLPLPGSALYPPAATQAHARAVALMQRGTLASAAFTNPCLRRQDTQAQKQRTRRRGEALATTAPAARLAHVWRRDAVARGQRAQASVYRRKSAGDGYFRGQLLIRGDMLVGSVFAGIFWRAHKLARRYLSCSRAPRATPAY